MGNRFRLTLRKFSGSPVFGWLALVLTNAVSVTVAFIVLWFLTRISHVAVPTVVMMTCS